MGAVALIVLAIILNVTTPSSAGSLGVLTVFVMMYVVFLVAFALLLQVFAKIFAGLGSRDKKAGVVGGGDGVNDSARGGMSQRRAYYLASVLAFAPLVILVSKSFGGEVVGIAAAVVLAVVGSLFVIKK